MVAIPLLEVVAEPTVLPLITKSSLRLSKGVLTSFARSDALRVTVWFFFARVGVIAATVVDLPTTMLRTTDLPAPSEAVTT